LASGLSKCAYFFPVNLHANISLYNNIHATTASSVKAIVFFFLFHYIQNIRQDLSHALKVESKTLEFKQFNLITHREGGEWGWGLKDTP
jgi:hypothetical protein